MSATPSVDPAAPAPAKRSLVSKLKIPGIILGIVGLEWVMAYVVMPSSTPAAPTVPASNIERENERAAAEAAVAEEAANDSASSNEEASANSHDKGHAKKEKAEDKGHGDKKAEKGGHGDVHADSKAAPKHSDAEEVDLGNFTVSGFQPASNSTLFITFHLFGTVRHKYVDEFGQRLDENQHRIRDNVIVIIRSAEIVDLTDAGLGLIKRRILETTNKTLGKPLLQEVVFSDFSFIEQ